MGASGSSAALLEWGVVLLMTRNRLGQAEIGCMNTSVIA
jgi:hypothetical protein